MATRRRMCASSPPFPIEITTTGPGKFGTPSALPLRSQRPPLSRRWCLEFRLSPPDPILRRFGLLFWFSVSPWRPPPELDPPPRLNFIVRIALFGALSYIWFTYAHSSIRVIGYNQGSWRCQSLDSTRRGDIKSSRSPSRPLIPSSIPHVSSSRSTAPSPTRDDTF